MGDDARLPPGPATVRGAAVTFRYNGRRIGAHEGETVGAALHAAGERVLMRSIKYHRPRGLFCNAGKCANCLVRVDGTPNVRACVTPVADGMEVETQNAFPSARRDVYSLVDRVFPRVFDYHARFIRPRLLTPLYHKVIRKMAGFGEIPDLRPVPPRRPAIARREVDVLVVGAGPSGLGAAVAAAEGAASVLVVDEGDRAGGSLLLHRDVEGRDGVRVSLDLLRRLEDAGGAFLPRAVALGCYLTDGHGDALPAPGVVPILTAERILEVRPRALVVASGHHETPPVFPANDLPGVMGARAALVLLHRHGILPGRRVLVAAPGEWATRAAEDLAKAGAEVAGIVGEGALADARIVEAHGGTHVEAVTLQQGERTWREAVDLVLASGDETPRVELLQQVGARLAPSGWSLAPHVEHGATSVPAVFAVGSVTGTRPLAQRLAEGAQVGEAAARHARSVSP